MAYATRKQIENEIRKLLERQSPRHYTTLRGQVYFEIRGIGLDINPEDWSKVTKTLLVPVEGQEGWVELKHDEEPTSN